MSETTKLKKVKRKKKAKPEPPPPPPPEPKIDPRFWLPNHLKEWVELRSKPKVLAIRRLKRQLTRFQRNGPMKPSQFKKWYNKQMLTLQKAYEKTLMIAENVEKEKYKARRRMKIQFIDWQRLEELSWPRRLIQKYKFPLEEDFPYNPKIFLNKSPKKGKCRPFIQKQIPPCFMHTILEQDFWYEYRFPVNKDAKRFKPTAREDRLSIPKTVQPAPQQEAGPPRQKMPKSRWSKHLKYLNFFAIDKSKMYPRKRQPELKRGKKICIRYLKPLVDRLSKPKKYSSEPDEKDLNEIKRTKSVNVSGAMRRLATPRKRLENQCCRKDPYVISKAAKSATASSRIVELAVPKKHVSLPEKGPWKPLVTRQNKSPYSYVCPKRETFPCLNYTNLIS